MILPDFLQVEPGPGFIRLTDHRIGLAEIVRLYNQGLSAEIIASHFPTLSLSVIYSVLAFYLQNQNDVDNYVAEDDRELRAQEIQARSARTNPTFEELRKRFNVMKRSGS